MYARRSFEIHDRERNGAARFCIQTHSRASVTPRNIMKTTELIAGPLDWAVIVALYGKHDPRNPNHVEHFLRLRGGHPLHQQAHYSTNPAHGMPIIAREKISRLYHHQGDEEVWACIGDPRDDEVIGYTGGTELIAAMRCFVASRLGDEVEVPQVLIDKAAGLSASEGCGSGEPDGQSDQPADDDAPAPDRPTV